MKAISFAFLGVLTLALSSCGSGTNSSVSTITTQPVGNIGSRLLGEAQVEIGGRGQVSAQTYQLDGNIISYRLVSRGFTDDTVRQKRMIQAVIELKNNTSQTLNNINIYSFYQAACVA